jgi:D-glycero-D-manno-heptose 1,7-bisphosphate phosphatase
MVTRIGRKAIFLDRDGVLNECEIRNGKPYAPKCLKDFVLMPNTKSAIEKLKLDNYLLIVVTNQPDIGNGIVDANEVELMHKRLQEDLQLDDIRICPHSQDAGCFCRKPKPGMLIEAGRDYQLDLKSCWTIGDRWSDIAAGIAAETKTIFIDLNYKETFSKMLTPEVTVKNLMDAVDFIIDNSKTINK